LPRHYPLLILFSTAQIKEIFREEKRLIRQILDRRQQADLLALSAMIAYKQFKDVLIKELFYEEDNMLKQSSFVREWIDEGIKEGEKKGLRMGRIELIHGYGFKLPVKL